MPTRSLRWWKCLTGALVFLPVLPEAGAAQTLDMRPPDWFSPDMAPTFASEELSARQQRIRLFRIATGYVCDPANIDPNDPASDDPANEPDPGVDWLSLTVGNDNPFRDFRWQGDPGGVGYSRLDAQVQLLDTATTGCAFGLQAVMPAGLQSNGVATGPTVLSPALALFHNLGDGFAVQSFVGKHFYMEGQEDRRPSHRIHYGLAVQRELRSVPEVPGNLFLFVEALGRIHYEDVPGAGSRPNVFDVLPGVQWRVAENCWLSSGLVLPAQPSPYDSRRWQVSCSLRF